MRAQACKVAVVSTYPPKNCGVATFTAALLDELRDHGELPDGCHVGVVALADPADELAYTDPIVEFDLRYDLAYPSPAMLEAVHFIHKAGYSHVIIQQARGFACHAWACQWCGEGMALESSAGLMAVAQATGVRCSEAGPSYITESWG